MYVFTLVHPVPFPFHFAYKLAILSATHLEYLRICVQLSIGWHRYALHLAASETNTSTPECSMHVTFIPNIKLFEKCHAIAFSSVEIGLFVLEPDYIL